jgi:hypothetical protein
MYEEYRFGSADFVRLMRAVTALALLVALVGGLIITLRAGRVPNTGPVEYAPALAAGVVLLEPADQIGPDPFTEPVAVDLGLDPALLALPPPATTALTTPHRRGSYADLLAAGDFGWELIRRRDRAGGSLSIEEIRATASEILGLDATVIDFDDRNDDGLDDDGSFTLRASDGSAVCVTPGNRRTLALAQGLPVDPDDGVASHGLSWDASGPCGSRATTQPANRTGGSPGVFGASTDGEVCDVGALVTALRTNPRLAEGWAGVHGLEEDGIGVFVAGLTPVILLRDTAVTSFGWSDGWVTTRQSILQRGTAVLIDRRGSPVIRCLSGSPLRIPQDLPATPDFQGDAWKGFTRSSTVEIVAATGDVSEFVLVDVQTGVPIRRAAGINGQLASLAGPLFESDS